MSKIALSSNTSGTGVFTIASPGTNTNRTLTLPDATGTVNISGLANEVPSGNAALPAIYPTGDNNTGIFFPAADTIAFAEGGAEVARFDSNGNFLIGKTTSSAGCRFELERTDNDNGLAEFKTNNASGDVLIRSSGGYVRLRATGTNEMAFISAGTERARIDSSGNLLVGKNSSSLSTAGVELRGIGLTQITRSGGDVLNLNRLSTYGTIVDFLKDGTSVGGIGSASAGTVYVGSGDTTLTFSPAGDAIVPSGTDGATRSGAIDLGNSGNRWDTIFATVGTINTSDRTEKQDIEELNDAERRVAVACKGLLRKYRLKSAVALKGEDARIHFGIIAQDLQAAFEAEGLDAGRYGMFIHSTWTDEETGEEKSLMGVRYSELLAFMIAVL